MRNFVRLTLVCTLSIVCSVGCRLDKAPTGTGMSSSGIIGAAGGRLELARGASVDIPPGVLAEDIHLIFREVSPEGKPAIPASFKAVGSMYSVTPHGSQFAGTVTMTLPQPGLSPGEFAVLTLDDDEDDSWTIVRGAKAIGKDSVSMSLEHFSYFQVAERVMAPDSPTCGNGKLDRDSGEICDDEDNDGRYGGCMPGCMDLGPFCGDGKVDGEDGENCDGDCATAASCMPTSACIPVMLVGNPNECNSACEMAAEITDCINDDMCCPAGCDVSTDNDCSFTCGNMLLEPGEGCEVGTDNECPTSCEDGIACTADDMGGTPDNCNASCSHTSISDPMDDDMCCPIGANATMDSDCSETCGNGTLEEGEICEEGIEDGCPADCEDDNPCTDDLLSGNPDNCSSHCSYTPIHMPIDGDECCPPGANTRSDSDCKPVCGNQVQEEGEDCDNGISGDCEPDCDDGDPCTIDKRTGNPATCNVRCVHEPIVDPSGNTKDQCCPKATGAHADNDADCKQECGNGVVESQGSNTETCEPGVGGGCPSRADCAGRYPDPCQVGQRTMSGNNECTRECTFAQITAPSGTTADSCCPSGANAQAGHAKFDTDCSASCGNGLIEDKESCDNGSGSPKPCPSSCNDNNDCTTDTRSGSSSQCNVVCTNAPITKTSGSTKDLCCPAGTGNNNNDADCPVVCGNKAIETGEQCDGNCPTKDACEKMAGGCDTAAFSGSACTRKCTTGKITSPSGTSKDSCCPDGANTSMGNRDVDCPSVCQNGWKESGETCDSGKSGDKPDDPCNTLAQCTGTDACTAYGRTGSTAQCDVRCTQQARIPGASDSVCCPADATYSEDPDCPGCGDGKVVSPETCDPGKSGSCDLNCDDSKQCTKDARTGSPNSCNVKCTHTTIGSSGSSSDGVCCPADATYSEDVDCGGCGDGEIESPETCDPGKPGSCDLNCDDNNPCTRDARTGSPDSCNVRCTHTAIGSSGSSSDGVCCPADATYSEDVDCGGCGDGEIDSPETCDNGSGSPKTCPSSCADNDGCTTDIRSGSSSTCDVVCTNTPITMPSGSTRDSCCPPNGNSNNDADCAAVCGNGEVESPETCDNGSGSPTTCPSGCADNDDCTMDVRSGSSSTCDVVCTNAPITTPSGSNSDGCCPGSTYDKDVDCPGCGDGLIDRNAGEVCDTGTSVGCPTSDADCGECQRLEQSGDACTARCVADDEACPPGDPLPGTPAQ